MAWDFSTFNKTMRWLAATCIGMTVLFFSGYLSPDFYPDGDNLGYIRALFATGGPAIIRCSVGMGIILFFTLIPKRNWLDRIEEAEYGPTILISVFLYCVLRP